MRSLNHYGVSWGRNGKKEKIVRRSFVAALAMLAVCASAFSGQYQARGYGRGYDEYARNPNAYECVSVNQAFVSIMHRSVRLKKSEGPRTKYTPTAFAVGYVHTMDKLQLGAAFNFEGGNRKLNYPGIARYKVRTNIPGISTFGTYRPFVDSTYLSASMFLGFANYKAKDLWTIRHGNVGGEDKEHRNVFSLGLEAGRTWVFGQGFQVTPHVGLDFSYAPSERYNMAGVAWDHLDSQTYWEIPLGVTLRKTFDFGGWLITPKADFTLVTRVGGVDPKNAHPGFSYRVADKWKTVGASADSFGARITLGVDARFTDRWTFGVEYIYEGRSKYNDHRISGSVGYAF